MRKACGLLKARMLFFAFSLRFDINRVKAGGDRHPRFLREVLELGVWEELVDVAT